MRKLFFLGLPVLLLALGVVLVGCGGEGSDSSSGLSSSSSPPTYQPIVPRPAPPPPTPEQVMGAVDKTVVILQDLVGDVNDPPVSWNTPVWETAREAIKAAQEMRSSLDSDQDSALDDLIQVFSTAIRDNIEKTKFADYAPPGSIQYEQPIIGGGDGDPEKAVFVVGSRLGEGEGGIPGWTSGNIQLYEGSGDPESSTTFSYEVVDGVFVEYEVAFFAVAEYRIVWTGLTSRYGFGIDNIVLVHPGTNGTKRFNDSDQGGGWTCDNGGSFCTTVDCTRHILHDGTSWTIGTIGGGSTTLTMAAGLNIVSFMKGEGGSRTPNTGAGVTGGGDSATVITLTAPASDVYTLTVSK